MRNRIRSFVVNRNLISRVLLCQVQGVLVKGEDIEVCGSFHD